MKDVLTPETTIDANHMVELAKVATERFKTKDQKDPRVIATNEMIDDVTAYCLALAGINMQIHGKSLVCLYQLKLPQVSYELWASSV